MLLLIVYIIFFLIAAGILWWAVNALITAFAVPQPFATVIIVVTILLLLLGFLDVVGVFTGHIVGMPALATH